MSDGTATREPRSAAARRASTDPSEPESAAGSEQSPEPESTAGPEGSPPLVAEQSDRPAPGPAHVGAAVPAGPDDLQVTPEELAMVRQIRATRSQEIIAAIDRAPQRVGTDVDPYTLVHLRGCPKPERTETYEVTNSGTGQRFTIHRCVECGAHLPIPH